MAVWDASLTEKTNSSSEFGGNTAVVGGSIALLHAAAVFDGESSFIGNTANYGGAVSFNEGCSAHVKGNLTFKGEPRALTIHSSTQVPFTQ